MRRIGSPFYPVQTHIAHITLWPAANASLARNKFHVLHISLRPAHGQSATDAIRMRGDAKASFRLAHPGGLR
jgi:hypothetical protein